MLALAQNENYNCAFIDAEHQQNYKIMSDMSKSYSKSQKHSNHLLDSNANSISYEMSQNGVNANYQYSRDSDQSHPYLIGQKALIDFYNCKSKSGITKKVKKKEAN
jgi:hypothetical protein